MASRRQEKRLLECYPLTRERWTDLEQLFGQRGACSGCWCMYWRLKRSEFTRQKGEGNKLALKNLIESGQVLGILGYLAGMPVGWCAVAPRPSYPVLERSRILKKVDEKPVWSVSCLFIDRNHRNRGLSVELLRAALPHVQKQGGTVVEGYPIEPKTDQPIPAAFAWTGLASAFLQAGFVECARRSETRPIMRLEIPKPRAARRRPGAC